MNNVRQIANDAARKAAEEILTEKRARLIDCKSRLGEIEPERTNLLNEIKQLKREIVHARRIVAPFRERITKRVGDAANALKQTIKNHPEEVAGVVIGTACTGGAAAIIGGAIYFGDK